MSDDRGHPSSSLRARRTDGPPLQFHVGTKRVHCPEERHLEGLNGTNKGQAHRRTQKLLVIYMRSFGSFTPFHHHVSRHLCLFGFVWGSRALSIWYHGFCRASRPTYVCVLKV